jgi:4'-phosphopantetheinyl transferase
MSFLQANEIQLWLVEDQSVMDPEILSSYQSLLSKEEKQRYERLLFRQQKKQFLVSRALLRCVLADTLGLAPEKLVFAKNAYGKPRLAMSALPDSLEFNLSHTNQLSVLALTRRGDIGVDVEYLTRKVDILKLAQRYFSQQEVDDLQALEPGGLNQRFFDLWTLKEAYIKACGMGLAIPLKDFSFAFSDAQIRLSFSAEREDDPGHWQFWQYAFKQQFQLALALRHSIKLTEQNLALFAGIPMQGFDPCEAEYQRSVQVASLK